VSGNAIRLEGNLSVRGLSSSLPTTTTHDTTPLLKWLDDTLQITDETEWKSLLRFRPEHARKVGGIEAILTDALRTEYILRLIGAVLSRTAKKSKKEGR